MAVERSPDRVRWQSSRGRLHGVGTSRTAVARATVRMSMPGELATAVTGAPRPSGVGSLLRVPGLEERPAPTRLHAAGVPEEADTGNPAPEAVLLRPRSDLSIPRRFGASRWTASRAILVHFDHPLPSMRVSPPPTNATSPPQSRRRRPGVDSDGANADRSFARCRTKSGSPVRPCSAIRTRSTTTCFVEIHSSAGPR